jgi:hypothetical protein
MTTQHVLYNLSFQLVTRTQKVEILIVQDTHKSCFLQKDLAAQDGLTPPESLHCCGNQPGIPDRFLFPQYSMNAAARAEKVLFSKKIPGLDMTVVSLDFSSLAAAARNNPCIMPCYLYLFFLEKQESMV